MSRPPLMHSVRREVREGRTRFTEEGTERREHVGRLMLMVRDEREVEN